MNMVLAEIGSYIGVDRLVHGKAISTELHMDVLTNGVMRGLNLQ